MREPRLHSLSPGSPRPPVRFGNAHYQQSHLRAVPCHTSEGTWGRRGGSHGPLSSARCFSSRRRSSSSGSRPRPLLSATSRARRRARTDCRCSRLRTVRALRPLKALARVADRCRRIPARRPRVLARDSTPSRSAALALRRPVKGAHAVALRASRGCAGLRPALAAMFESRRRLPSR